jgi:hypothetical protein
MLRFFGLSSVVFFLSLVSSTAQDQTLRYEDYVYQSYIRSVKFTQKGLYLSQPVLVLEGKDLLELEFDDMEADSKSYYYRIIQCDVNWQPTPLNELEYIDGYSNDLIREYHNSFRTTTAFTHYRLILPNENTRITRSGNYILQVYENARKEVSVLTRRFIVMENKVFVNAKLVPPAAVGKFRTHQEIDFEVSVDKLPVGNMRQEVKATILQNNRWDNAVHALVPNFNRLNNLVWDYQDKVVFPAGKEFRWLDMRSLFLLGSQISAINRINNRYEVIMKEDREFESAQYFQIFDLNGDFVIGNNDQRGMRLNENLQRRPNLNTEGIRPNPADWKDLAQDETNHFNNSVGSDYAEVLFSLSMNEPLPNQEVYLVGRFNDWQMQPQYKMSFDEVLQAYTVRTPLKQGYYNYAYATKPNNASKASANFSPIDGDWWETENVYTIIIYFRAFGERYDRVIGMGQIQSGIR